MNSSPDTKESKTKEEEQHEVWKWWEEKEKQDGPKWSFLEHKGPVFAPPYERLPEHVKFYYNDSEMVLSEDAEEIAGFYAKILNHEYTTKPVFNNNFFKDWRQVMTEEERTKITELEKCNFSTMHDYFMDAAGKIRNNSEEEALLKEYGFCTIDDHTEKIDNFKIEPPGLFRGRGEHPKMGSLKKRLQPEDIIINCSKDSKVPVAPSGHKWKEVCHDPSAIWLASWTENVQNQVKYIMLKNWQKYETSSSSDDSLAQFKNKRNIEEEEEEPCRSEGDELQVSQSSDEDLPLAATVDKNTKKRKDTTKTNSSPDVKKGRMKKDEEQQVTWKWWEAEKKDDSPKWYFLEHNGPVFAPPYERLPEHVKFYYNDSEIVLSEDAEEVAGFYAKILNHEHTTKPAFNNNFFKDWRQVMTEEERTKITELEKCNFRTMYDYFTDAAEKTGNNSEEEALLKEYGFCKIDDRTEIIDNFKIEPPGLFRGRGEHPKMGSLKRRIQPEDITINCSKHSKVPVAPPGHKWKDVCHDPSAIWLASWTENVQNQVMYITLYPRSKLKCETDLQNYETARRLHKSIDKIRDDYIQDLKSKEMLVKQRAVAMYFIDRLALRAGNENEDQADTFGCCSLHVEHIELHEKKDDLEYVVVFDFLGKDSIRYYNEVSVEKRVFKNLQLFIENKKGSDNLFDHLNTSILIKHLTELMEGLTAKVFHTYNASFTLQQQLDKLTNADDSVLDKLLSYNHSNRAVAILCNHYHAVPKSYENSMDKLKEQIIAYRNAIKDAECQVEQAIQGSVIEKSILYNKKKLLEQLRDQLAKLEIQKTDREETKRTAMGMPKLNYLDPRISVAWCKKYNVPIEKIYNRTQRDEFHWAVNTAGSDYRFL